MTIPKRNPHTTKDRGTKMFIFGAVSKKELEKIKAQGWQIDRMLKKSEVNAFVTGKSIEEVEAFCDDEEDAENDDVYALIYVDSDVFKNLNDWHGKANAYSELDKRKQLEADCRAAADKAWDEYNFPDDIEIIDSEGWEYDSGLNRWEQKFYYGSRTARENEPSTIGTFIVIFNPDSSSIVDAYANL